MAQTTNIDLIIAVRDLVKKGLQQAGVDLVVFDVTLPSYTEPSSLPDEFVLVKAINHYGKGNIDTYGTVEVCIYVRNLPKDNDPSQPDLSGLKHLTDIIYPILADGVYNSTAILDIRSRIVNHSEIRFHYNSLVCETISIN